MSYYTAYGLSERFPPPPDCHKVGSLDPGDYYLGPFIHPKENKAPFLSRCSRSTLAAAPLYTHAIYHAEKPYRIVGSNPMSSRVPRFKEDAIQNDEEHACECDLQKCTCPADCIEKEEICQAHVPRKLYKGHVPFSNLCKGLSMPSRKHKGYLVAQDGKCEPIPTVDISDKPPPFYETHVNELTAFYRGCKWSHWTSKRGGEKLEMTPGPADYQHEHVPSLYELCIENLRFQRRRNTRQLRFIEMVQLRDILQGGPGPADYDPKLPKCDPLSYLGPKAERFLRTLEVKPGPADYYIDGSRPNTDKNCKCYKKNLPVVNYGSFGTAERFKYRLSDMPGPAEYSTRIEKMEIDKKCSLLAFGSSTARFKSDLLSESDEDNEMLDCITNLEEECPHHTWVFKSNTERFKPLQKRLDLASPADHLLRKKKCLKRALTIQRASPFNSSEGRFRPWHDWMPVHGAQVTPVVEQQRQQLASGQFALLYCAQKSFTPTTSLKSNTDNKNSPHSTGPGLYALDVKPSCASHGIHMPQARRFPRARHGGPAPNAYNVDSGIETVCHTFNKRLQNNQPKLKSFNWKPLIFEPRSIRSREKALITKSINDLDAEMDLKLPEEPVEILTGKRRKSIKEQRPRIPGEKLLLKFYVYDREIPKTC